MTFLKFQSKIIYHSNNQSYVFNSNELILTILDTPNASNFYRPNVVCASPKPCNNNK